MSNYITLKEMGSSGGLCSQLQIFASLVAVAKANNLDSFRGIEHGKKIYFPPLQ